jgi:long-subunit fatty acid transport protein
MPNSALSSDHRHAPAAGRKRHQHVSFHKKGRFFCLYTDIEKVMKKSLITCFSCIALSLLSLSASVHAARAGFSGLTALADSPDTAFWNPAGMTRLPRSLELQLVTAFINNDFKVEEATFSGGDPKSENDLLLIPSTYYVHPLNDN